jgi:hypothetical protein
VLGRFPAAFALLLVAAALPYDNQVHGRGRAGLRRPVSSGKVRLAGLPGLWPRHASPGGLKTDYLRALDEDESINRAVDFREFRWNLRL